MNCGNSISFTNYQGIVILHSSLFPSLFLMNSSLKSPFPLVVCSLCFYPFLRLIENITDDLVIFSQILHSVCTQRKRIKSLNNKICNRILYNLHPVSKASTSPTTDNLILCHLFWKSLIPCQIVQASNAFFLICSTAPP